MNRTFWTGYVAVFVVVQAIGFLVHSVWLTESYERLAAVFRPEAEMNEMMWMMMAGSVIYLFLFCFIFTKGREGKGIAEGLRYGLLMGLFMALPMSIDQYVVYPLPGLLVGIWFAVGLASFVIAGAVFAAIYRPSSA